MLEVDIMDIIYGHCILGGALSTMVDHLFYITYTVDTCTLCV